jgi:hypothetical protein
MKDRNTVSTSSRGCDPFLRLRIAMVHIMAIGAIDPLGNATLTCYMNVVMVTDEHTFLSVFSLN